MHVKIYFLKFKKYGILNYIHKKSITTKINLSILHLSLFSTPTAAKQSVGVESILTTVLISQVYRNRLS
jgi:hypothetical protein